MAGRPDSDNASETPGKRLIALSGPSCGGKGPLQAAAAEFHPEVPFVSLAAIKSKESRGGEPRPDERDIWDDPDYFRPRAEIESLEGERYLHAVTHGNPQVLDLDRVVSAEGDLIVLEATQTVSRQLPAAAWLRGIEVTTLFVSPLGSREIGLLKKCGVDVAEFLKGLNVRRLLARAAFHGRQLDDAFLADVAVRAGDAIEELQAARHFDFVLVNRAGEGAPDWNRDADGRFHGRPQGEAAAALDAFVDLLAGRESPALESWERSPI